MPQYGDAQQGGTPIGGSGAQRNQEGRELNAIGENNSNNNTGHGNILSLLDAEDGTATNNTNKRYDQDSNNDISLA